MSDLPELVPAALSKEGDVSSVTGDGLRGRRGRAKEAEAGMEVEAGGGEMEKPFKEKKYRPRKPRERSKPPSEASDSEDEPRDLSKVSPAALALLAEIEAEEAAEPPFAIRFCKTYMLPLIVVMLIAAVVASIKPGWDDWNAMAGEAMMSEEEQMEMQVRAGVRKPKVSGTVGKGADPGAELARRKDWRESRGRYQSEVTRVDTDRGERGPMCPEDTLHTETLA